MRKPGLFVVGIVLTLAGVVFSLQGFDVIEGSGMSDSTFWSVAGPVVAIAGLLLVWAGVRGRVRGQ